MVSPKNAIKQLQHASALLQLNERLASSTAAATGDLQTPMALAQRVWGKCVRFEMPCAKTPSL